ncbi:MAG: CHAD domain-containing protein [Betaproteobacteria bacterium]|nr:CHAD domain-containing protein [Betaproteobacteria bacterium]
MSTEIELKLTLSADALEAARAHPILAAAETVAPRTLLDNTYFDTPELALRRERIGLRLRRIGKRTLQTVKCAASSLGGLSSRPEWEQPYRGKRFDFSRIEIAAVRERLESLREHFTPVFSTRFERQTLRVRPRPEASILIMLDHGGIEAAGRSMPLCELELELESGTPADLFEVAIALAHDLPLAPEDISKAQRGYALFRNQTAQPQRAGASSVKPGMRAREAFCAIGFDALAMWQANDAYLHVAHNSEFLHQARIALRRLRSAFTLFAKVLPEDAKTWRARTGAFAAELGSVRDADVVHRSLLTPILAQEPVSQDFHRLAQLVARARDAARQAIAHRRRGCAMLELAAFLHALPAQEGGKPIEKLARHALRRTRRQARQCAQAAENGRTAKLHHLRIVLKRLRYGLEFFAPLWPEQAISVYAKSLAALQDELGEINDAAMGDRLLAEIAQDDAGLGAARAYTADWHAPRIAQLQQRAIQHARELLWNATPPWKQAER